MEPFYVSGHQYIVFKIVDTSSRRTLVWHSSCLWTEGHWTGDWDIRQSSWNEQNGIGVSSEDGRGAVIIVVNSVMNLLTIAYEASMSWRSPSRNKP